MPEIGRSVKQKNEQKRVESKKVDSEGKTRESGIYEQVSLQSAVENPSGARSEDILNLQRTSGNQAVSALLKRSAPPATGRGDATRTRQIQAKLTVGPVGDQYEQEADRVADQIIHKPAPAGDQGVKVARKVEEEEDLQMKPGPAFFSGLVQRNGGRGGFEANKDVENQLNASRGEGKALSPRIRSEMEPKFGADFGGVKVHSGLTSSRLSRDLQAKAFTSGRDIYFGEGKFNPGTQEGKRLLAHELTHVVQQGGAGKVQRQEDGTLQKKPLITNRVQRAVVQRDPEKIMAEYLPKIENESIRVDLRGQDALLKFIKQNEKALVELLKISKFTISRKSREANDRKAMTQTRLLILAFNEGIKTAQQVKEQILSTGVFFKKTKYVKDTTEYKDQRFGDLAARLDDLKDRTGHLKVEGQLTGDKFWEFLGNPEAKKEYEELDKLEPSFSNQKVIQHGAKWVSNLTRPEGVKEEKKKRFISPIKPPVDERKMDETMKGGWNGGETDEEKLKILKEEQAKLGKEWDKIKLMQKEEYKKNPDFVWDEKTRKWIDEVHDKAQSVDREIQNLEKKESQKGKKTHFFKIIRDAKMIDEELPGMQKEVMMPLIARGLGVDTLNITRGKKRGTAPVLFSKAMEARNFDELDYTNEEDMSNFKKLKIDQLQKTIVFDMLFENQDAHFKQYMLTEQGDIIKIDQEDYLTEGNSGQKSKAGSFLAGLPQANRELLPQVVNLILGWRYPSLNATLHEAGIFTKDEIKRVLDNLVKIQNIVRGDKNISARDLFLMYNGQNPVDDTMNANIRGEKNPAVKYNLLGTRLPPDAIGGMREKFAPLEEMEAYENAMYQGNREAKQGGRQSTILKELSKSFFDYRKEEEERLKEEEKEEEKEKERQRLQRQLPDLRKLRRRRLGGKMLGKFDPSQFD